MKQAQIGIIGLGVMGRNLARNMAGRRISTLVYNRTPEKMEAFIHDFGGTHLTGAQDLADFVMALQRPRAIVLMIEAGPAIDDLITHIAPFLEAGDILVDAGNSHFYDTIRREAELEKINVYFVGCGISGGEEGALHGPSLMPGGNRNAWKHLKPMFEKIAAKDFHGKPCVAYVGPGGSGHFVKMVHNGIEYGVMQLLAEAYDMLRKLYSLSAPDIASIFSRFQRGRLHSFLLEIAIPVLRKQDDLADGWLVDHILDVAGQKGTGSWTAIEALDRGVAIPTLSEAVHARNISTHIDLRKKLHRMYRKPAPPRKPPLKGFESMLQDALYAAVLIAYFQGYDLINQTSRQMKWNISLAELSRIWQGGCIIRSDMLRVLEDALRHNSNVTHLLELPGIKTRLQKALPALRTIITLSSQSGIACPAMMGSLGYFDALTTEKSPANLIQGLRDYFGAHAYQRIDKKGAFHFFP